ncbi:unnamed protein product [Pleuronectes platessa]|uniref:Uncharacterized protein n=1 Tax=Pleuronectes platessa TaxID=8262 RepID=A0A9N7USE1_PLEPL|nr:unnamed protein product [Pleuronectes platessa]
MCFCSQGTESVPASVVHKGVMALQCCLKCRLKPETKHEQTGQRINYSPRASAPHCACDCVAVAAALSVRGGGRYARQTRMFLHTEPQEDRHLRTVSTQPVDRRLRDPDEDRRLKDPEEDRHLRIDTSQTRRRTATRGLSQHNHRKTDPE